MRHFLAVSIVLASFGICTVAAAENPVPNKPGEGNLPTPQQMQQKLIERFDANRDGRLSEQEQLQAQEFLRRQGGLIPGVGPAGFPGAAEFLKRFDANGDGQLSPQEKMMAQSAYQRMRSQGGGGAGGGAGPGAFPNPGTFPNPADNVGGVIPADEEKPDKRSPLVKRFDKDGDGKLSKEEKADAQAELKKPKTKTKPKTKAKLAKKPAEKSDKDK